MKRLLALLSFALPALGAFGQSVFDIKINEVLASGAAVQSPEGRGYDRIELFNPTASDIDLSGAAVTDQSFSNKMAFAAGTVIPAGGFYVVNLDPGNTNYGHFNLARGGDTVVFGILVGNVVAPIHTVTFGPQVTDLSFGAVPDGSENWTLLAAPSFGQTNAPGTYGDPKLVRLNEWFPKNGEEFIELFNTDNKPINLNELTIEDSTSGPYRLPVLSFIGVGESNAFQVLEPTDSSGGRNLPFKLGSTDAITLRLIDTTEVDKVDWTNLGNNDSQGRVPDGGSSIATLSKQTPGAANFGVITEVVVNELLTHTDPPLEDAIEFYNTTGVPLNIGGWYLGGIEWWKENPKGNNFIEKLKRYQFPANTIIPANGYLTIYEYQFKNNPLDDNFTLNSAHGGSLFLSKPDANGNILAYLERKYDPAANGVSFGRVTTSDGDDDFVAMSALTFGQKPGKPLRSGLGASNSVSPAWGPVIINEVMYAPPSVEPGVTNTIDEYIELRNVTKSRVPLFDPLATTNGWKVYVDDKKVFTFINGDYIEANGFLLLVNFDPSTNVTQLNDFRTKYSVPAEVPILGPYEGNLGVDDVVELFRPDPPQSDLHPDAGFVPYILTDRVHYENKGTNWPQGSNMTGKSLQRANAISYGDEPLSWRDDAPTAGAINAHPIAITTQPQTQSVLQSNTAVFTITVQGSEPQFQWLLNGKPISPKLGAIVNSSGDTSQLYIQANRKTAGVKGGRISCVVTNFAGRLVSDTAYLTNVLPVIVKWPSKDMTFTKRAGTAKLTLPGKAIGTAPQYQWYKDGQPIEGATSAKLTLTNLTSGTNVYTLVAYNLKSTQQSHSVTVAVP